MGNTDITNHILNDRAVAKAYHCRTIRDEPEHRLRIEAWAVVTPNPDPYSAPETQSQCLRGRVFNHPKFDNGFRITTSSIRGKSNNDEVVTYSGSCYELGQIEEAYEKAFPGARKRLLDSLPIINDQPEE